MEKNQMQPTWIHAGNLRRHLKAHSRERSNKCNQCDFTFIQAGNLRPHTQWREAKQMQPMGLYTYKGRRFKESFENTTTMYSGQKP